MKYTNICPACRKEVKRNSHKCVHCGERYGVPVKISPKVLENPKKLEAYVHKHIFPRVSEFERNYLTKYFTILFSDGFESGTIIPTDVPPGAWTSIAGTPVVQNLIKHHGVYAAEFDLLDSAAKNLTDAQNNLFGRVYVRFATLPAPGEYGYFIYFFDDVLETTFMGGVNINNIAGQMKWNLNIWGIDFSVDAVISADVWYCVEFEYDNNTDIHNLWVDGVNVIPDVARFVASAVQRFVVGRPAGNYVAKWYIDCVVVADAYIGVEAEAIVGVFHGFNRVVSRAGELRSRVGIV